MRTGARSRRSAAGCQSLERGTSPPSLLYALQGPHLGGHEHAKAVGVALGHPEGILIREVVPHVHRDHVCILAHTQHIQQVPERTALVPVHLHEQWSLGGRPPQRTVMTSMWPCLLPHAVCTKQQLACLLLIGWCPEPGRPPLAGPRAPCGPG